MKIIWKPRSLISMELLYTNGKKIMYFLKINVSWLLSLVWWDGTQSKFKKCPLQEQYEKSKKLLCKSYHDMMCVLLWICFLSHICSTDDLNKSRSKSPSFRTHWQTIIGKLSIGEFDKYYEIFIFSWKKSEKSKFAILNML